MQIELIEREKTGRCIARIFDKGLLIFRSWTCETRALAIAEAQEWAVVNFGEELEVSDTIETLPLHSCYCPPREQHKPRRGRDPAYGKNRPLPANNKDLFDGNSG